MLFAATGLKLLPVTITKDPTAAFAGEKEDRLGFCADACMVKNNKQRIKRNECAFRWSMFGLVLRLCVSLATG